MRGVRWTRWFKGRPGRLPVIGGAIVLAIILVTEGVVLDSLIPHKRAAAILRDSDTLDQVNANINRVSQWPEDWVNAVCKQPVYTLRNYKRLPHAMSNSSCDSIKTGAGDLANYVIISRFPNELAMQVDLSNEGYDWYAFVFQNGSIISFATMSDDTGTPGPNGLSVTPVLEPLVRFGFNIYSRPGPP